MTRSVLPYAVNCDAGYDYVGREFVLLFLENERQDLQLELHYAEQNDQQAATIVVTSPRIVGTPLNEQINVQPGGELHMTASMTSRWLMCQCLRTFVYFFKLLIVTHYET